MPETKKCHKCGKEFIYHKEDDKKAIFHISINGRKVIIDDNGNSFPLFAMPLDKRKIIDESKIHFVCDSCLSKENF